MKEKLIKLLDKSYSPYSHFRVSAIVVMEDGNEFTGVNVENSSFGMTICAERCAILKAVSTGYRKGQFKEIHIMCDSSKISACCFLCRQVITEFYDADAKIILYNNLGETEEYKVKELCPKPFNEDDLK